MCGRSNIPLCGHRDNATDVEKDIHRSENHGNIRALLKFGIDAGNSIVFEHLLQLLRMPHTHHQLFKTKSLRFSVIKSGKRSLPEVKQVGWYTIIADEVTDASNREQLSLLIGM